MSLVPPSRAHSAFPRAPRTLPCDAHSSTNVVLRISQSADHHECACQPESVCVEAGNGSPIYLRCSGQARQAVHAPPRLAPTAAPLSSGVCARIGPRAGFRVTPDWPQGWPHTVPPARMRKRTPFPARMLQPCSATTSHATTSGGARPQCWHLHHPELLVGSERHLGPVRACVVGMNTGTYIRSAHWQRENLPA